MRTALTIAGSDSGGGAGIQADIKTMTAHGVFAMCAVTALTAQNTLGVSDIMEVSPEFIERELDAVFADFKIDAVKTGMVSSAALISAIARKLREHGAAHIVVDPVMVATSGARLLREDALTALKTELLPLAELATPNIPEAEILAEMQIRDSSDIERAAELISARCGCSVLLKGGHSLNDASDFLYISKKSAANGGSGRWFLGERVENPNTHGTGCTLSSAIAANLAKGCTLEQSIAGAKDYLSGALKAMLDMGHGRGPLNHMYDLTSRFITA